MCLVGSKEHGVDALLGHWMRWARCVNAFELGLGCIETAQVTPNALKATARVSTTFSESTVRDVFPQLFATRRGDGNGHSDADLARRLCGYRLEFSYAMWFECDPLSSKVLRLRSQLDLIPAMLRVLGSLNAVARVLDGSRLTDEGFLLFGGNRNDELSPNIRDGISGGGDEGGDDCSRPKRQ